MVSSASRLSPVQTWCALFRIHMWLYQFPLTPEHSLHDPSKMTLFNILAISPAFSTPVPILWVIVKHLYCNFPNVLGQLMWCLIHCSLSLTYLVTSLLFKTKVSVLSPDLCILVDTEAPPRYSHYSLFVPSPWHLFCWFVTAPSRLPREENISFIPVLKVLCTIPGTQCVLNINMTIIGNLNINFLDL